MADRLGVYDIERRQNGEDGKLPVHAVHPEVISGQHHGGCRGRLGGPGSGAAIASASSPAPSAGINKKGRCYEKTSQVFHRCTPLNIFLSKAQARWPNLD